MSNNTTRWDGCFILLLTLIVILSFWPLVFTKQFTTVAQWEIVNQAYAWDTYAAKTIQSGSIPLWDPYRFAGKHVCWRDADRFVLSVQARAVSAAVGFQ